MLAGSDKDMPPLPPNGKIGVRVRQVYDCGGHACAGYFQGDNAIIFDGADWLGKSLDVSKLLTDKFKEKGFTLRIINKVYQTVLGNCAMFSAVCVFLILIYGEPFFFGYMDNVPDVEKNKLIESTALKIREKAVPLLFNLTLFFSKGKRTTIPCNKTAKTRKFGDALKQKAVSIIVPKGITTIGEFAFHECHSLVSVTLPEGITTIGEFSFNECHSLVSITLPEAITTIGEFAFGECNSLAAITLPRGIRTIEQYAFFKCFKLASITLPEGITTIERGIFQECTSLVSATIPKTVTVIEENAFCECNSLDSITLPEGLTTIGPGAFYYCASLASINIPKSVTRIGDRAFWRCELLVLFTIPEGVTLIEEMAFQGCTSLTSINIPEGVKTIEAGGFRGCWKLKLVSLPSTLKEITGGLMDGEPNGAFQECTVLDSITLPRGMTTIGDFAFYNCNSLASISIPEGVTTIGARAFERCTELKSIIFPSSVLKFGQDILAGCTSLQRIYYAANGTGRRTDLFSVPESVTTYLEFSYKQAVEHNIAEISASKRKELDRAGEPEPKRRRSELFDWTRSER